MSNPTQAQRGGLRTFYALAATQAFSLIGSRMTAVAVGVWVFAETGRTAPLLLAAFFLELPGMLIGSLAGVLVDRWPRKPVLILTDVGQAAGSLLLLISLLTGAFQLWHLYAVAAFQGLFVTLQGPAQGATVTLLVPERHRERANGIQELAFPLAGIVAPVLAGLAYAAVGVQGVIAIDLATFAAAALVVAFLSIPRAPITAEGRAAAGSLLREWRGGLRALRQRPALWKLVVYLTFSNFMLNGPLELMIPYFIALTGSEARMGLALGLAGLGAFAGAGLMTVLGGYRPRMRLMLAAAVLNGVMFLAFGTARSLPALGASIFLLMLPLPMINALFRSIAQVKVPPDLQGRVFGVQSQLALLGSTTSFLLVGPLVDRVLEPLAAGPGWGALARGFGSGPGAGIGLLLAATGVILLGAAALTFGRREIREMEARLPDYVPEAEVGA
jgi:DHA3 family macrolide efflux protein-like MFS transporter